MICKLCLKEKKLIKAHIIPNFLYKNLELYQPDANGQGRLHLAKIQNDNFSYNPKGISNSEYDTNILCSDCDNKILGAYEDYAKKVLFDDKTKLEFSFVNDTNLGCEYGHFKGIDYTKFKLFLLSIFWRASISDRPFSSEVNFGEEKNEVIRKMLLEGKLDTSDDFSTILYSYSYSSNEPRITNFKKFETNNTTRYAFMANGMIFNFFLNQNDIPKNHTPFILSAALGELKVYNMSQDHFQSALKAFDVNLQIIPYES